MKQCPVCQHTYPDERLSYCLEDGAALFNLSAQSDTSSAVTQPSPRVKYTSEPTMRVPPNQFISVPRIINETAPAKSSRWIIFTIIGLVFVLFCGGVGAFLVLRSKNNIPQNSPNSNENKAVTFVGNTNVNENRQAVIPAPPIAPTASQLVGTWKTSVVENKVPMDITVTFNADGTSKFLFKNKRGQTAADSATWQFSDGILYERYSNGASGKGTVKFIDDDNADITIIDNGVPAYNGIVRHYHRIK